MKRYLFVSGIVMGCLLCGINSYAVPTLVCKYQVRPGMTGRSQDVGRSAVGFIQGIVNLCGDGEAKYKLIAKQEENNQKASGAGGSAASTDTSLGQLDTKGTAGTSEFPGSAFDYVNANVLAKQGGVGYTPIKTALTSAQNTETLRSNIRAAVIKEFFADPKKSEQTTTEYKNKIDQNRSQYIQDAANRHVTLGYRVKGHIQNDLAAISSAAVSGDGELGSIAVDAHTLEQMVKMELVDLALQIEMMEADAVQFLQGQPIELMDKTKPTS